jgi:hypothetical protein
MLNEVSVVFKIWNIHMPLVVKCSMILSYS